jgi:hypothetical protein
MNIDEITSSIKEKLGDEESGKIADDLASLIIHDKALNESLVNKDKEIEKLKNDKDLLVSANANLLLKIPAGKVDDDEFSNNSKEEEYKPFDFRTVFKDGKFKR